MGLLDHLREGGEVLELHVDPLDLGLGRALDRLEGAGADQRQARLAFPPDVDVDGVVERRPLADELPVLPRQVDEVPVETGVETRRETRGDVGG